MEPVDALDVSLTEDADGTAVLVLAGELDLGTAVVAERVLDALPEPDEGDAVVIDMTDLTFMDSSGLTVLLLVANRGYAVRLRGPGPIIRDLIAATGLNETLPVEP